MHNTSPFPLVSKSLIVENESSWMGKQKEPSDSVYLKSEIEPSGRSQSDFLSMTLYLYQLSQRVITHRKIKPAISQMCHSNAGYHLIFTNNELPSILRRPLSTDPWQSLRRLIFAVKSIETRRREWIREIHSISASRHRLAERNVCCRTSQGRGNSDSHGLITTTPPPGGNVF